VTDGPLPVVRRLVGDVQRFGLLSASTVVDRYVDAVDRTMRRGGVGPPSADRPSTDPDTGQLVASAARLAQAYGDALSAAARVVSPSRDGSEPGVALRAARPGDRAETSLWLHNPTGAPLVDVVPATSSWVAAGGAVLGASTVSFDPAVLPPVPPGGSVELQLAVLVPPDQPCGTYHGLVVVSSSPEQPLAVSLQVSIGEQAR
jgi:hypothetical protein